MTTEEKAKAYDEALNWMRELYPGLHGATKEDAEHYFPELCESKDEKIRKALIQEFKEKVQKSFEWKDGIPNNAVLDWLEKQKEQHIPWYDYQKSKEAGYTIVPNEEYEQLIKQKEQKPAEKQDYSDLTDLERAIHRGFLAAGVENVPVTIIKETAKECKRTQTIANENANAEWSEEDELMRTVIIQTLERFGGRGTTGMQIDWLKSLRPQSHWKPSEEQMDRLFSIVAALRKDYCDDMADFLANLYADLKKLGVKEEPEYYQHFDPDC